LVEGEWSGTFGSLLASQNPYKLETYCIDFGTNRLTQGKVICNAFVTARPMLFRRKALPQNPIEISFERSILIVNLLVVDPFAGKEVCKGEVKWVQHLNAVQDGA
jgi:hypothetical protein